MAVKRATVFAAACALVGPTVMLVSVGAGTGVTVTTVSLVIVPTCALIVAVAVLVVVPAVASPVPLTPSSAELLELHVAEFETFCIVLSV